MKRLFLLVSLCAGILFSQEKVLQTPEKPISFVKGCQKLWKQSIEMEQYAAAHPVTSVSKRTAWDFVVGDQHSWWATGFESEREYEYLVPSTCKAVGEKAYYFVENSLLSSGKVTQEAVVGMATAFEKQTPTSTTNGIFQLASEAFGDVPNVDGDPRIIILILDIDDEMGPGEGYVAGYFFSLNQYPDGTFSGRRSNYTEILYVDGSETNLRTSFGRTVANFVTSHELQHMIHWRYDKLETVFVNEMCSEVSSLICGYPLGDHGIRYVSTTSLFSWYGTAEDYSRAELFGLYLWEQFSSSFFKPLVNSYLVGSLGIEEVLKLKSERSLSTLYQDWIVANVINNTVLNSRWGYSATFFIPSNTQKQKNPNTGPRTQNLPPFSAVFLDFVFGKNLRAQFDGPSSTVRIARIGSSTEVNNVPLGVEIKEEGFGTTYPRIVFFLSSSSNTTASIFYEVKGEVPGVVELRWDEEEPVGYFKWGPGDTVCVVFDSFYGARLDSIKVATRRVGKLFGVVKEFAGTIRPSPGGKVLVSDFVIPSLTTSPVPYSVPYSNWASADVRSSNVITNDPFVVLLPILSDTSQDAYIMVTQHLGDLPYYSYTYINNPGGGLSPGWYYIINSKGNAYIYLVRAYVSFSISSTERQTVELVPSRYELFQNYPNPFNPSTLVEYSLSERDLVLLKVFNILGEEVRVLENGWKEAGKYRVTWNGKSNYEEEVSSGVYYIVLNTREHFLVKKAILIR